MWYRYLKLGKCYSLQTSNICYAFLLIFFIQIAEAKILTSPLDEAIKTAKNLEEKVNLNLDAGDLFLNADQSRSAKRYYERAVTEGTRLGDNEVLAKAMVKLAHLQENKSTARSLYQSALDIYGKLQKQNNLLSAEVLESIVWTYDYTGVDNKLVVDLMQKAIAIRKHNKDMQNLSSSLRTLGWLYEVSKNLLKAENSYHEALNIDLQNLGFEDIRVVLAMENFAQFFIDTEQYGKAEGQLWNKIKRHKREKYIDYYNLARSESMLAWVYLKRENSYNAEKYFLIALEDIQKSMASDVSSIELPDYALPNLLDLIYFYAQSQQFQKAIPYLRQAEKLLKESGDGSLSEHAQFIENQILSGNGVSYPWSAEAQIDGIQLMIEYLQNKPQ